MYNQIFTPKTLYDISSHVQRRDMGKSKQELIDSFSRGVIQDIYDGTFHFKIRHEGEMFLNDVDKHDVIAKSSQDLIIGKLNKNICHAYGIKPSSRNKIISQIINLLKDGSSYWILRLDIHRFYESINTNKLISKLSKDGHISYQSLSLIKQLFSLSSTTQSGLPRGLSISSGLSEFCLRDVDYKIRRLDGVVYYARFVDDIIVFCCKEEIRDSLYKLLIPKILNEIGLTLNRNKSGVFCSDDISINKPLVYLGYSFYRQPGGKQLLIDISSKKINVIKTRIARSMLSFQKNGNILLLEDRVAFLTGNCKISIDHSLMPIEIGFRNVYKYISTKNSLKLLDIFYRESLSRLTKQNPLFARFFDRLIKYSFQNGFDLHIKHHFSSNRLARIKQCWR